METTNNYVDSRTDEERALDAQIAWKVYYKHADEPKDFLKSSLAMLPQALRVVGFVALCALAALGLAFILTRWN